MSIFGTKAKSRNGDVRWEWVKGRAVTGHLNKRRHLVDVRKASMEIYMGLGGEVIIAFIPAKGVNAQKVAFVAEPVETRNNRYGRCEITKIKFTFFDEDIWLNLTRRYQIPID